MKKPYLSIRVTLLLIIGFLNVLVAVLVGSDVYDSWIRLRQAQAITRSSALVNDLYQAEKYLSVERAASLSVLYVAADTADSLEADIAMARKEADSYLDRGLTPRGQYDEATAAHIGKVKKDLGSLQELRRNLDAALAKPFAERDQKLPDRLFDASTSLIMDIRDLAGDYIRPVQNIDAPISRQMMFKHSIWETTEYAGREYAVLGRLVAEEAPVTPELQTDLMTWRTLISHGWEAARELVAGTRLEARLAPYINEAQTHYFLTFGQIKDIFYAPAASPEAPYPLSAEMWLVLSSEAVDSLTALKDAALKETQNYVARMEKQAQNKILASLLLFLCATAISLYCLVIIVRRVIRPVNAMVDALYKTSQGQPHDPLPALQREDEIGKLANVLEVLEENILQIKQSNEELERYAYITAHDLKSPLRAIDNLSQWIEEDLGETLTGKTKEHMTTLRKRTRRMEKLLNDTLEYSRIGKTEPDRVEILNGKVLVEDAASMTAPPAGFTVRISDDFARLNLARMPLQQVFYNLINNAIKHHDKSEGLIEVNVEDAQDFYIFSVKDDGAGIPEQYHKKVFEMFQTLKPRDQREGSGMGLAIVKKILTTAGGNITLESGAGRGTTFRFAWPKSHATSGKERKVESKQYA